MKNTKKITSVVAALAIVGSFAALPASAKVANDCSVTYTTLAESITTTEGDYIPAGSIAVTMSIQNNSGFTDNMFLLNLDDGFDVILNDNNKPIIETDDVLDGFIVAGSVEDDNFCVAVASTHECLSDGEMFTFYCSAEENATGDPVSIGTISNNISFNEGNVASPAVNIKRIHFGDVNGDGSINASDATYIMIAVSANNGDAILLSYLYANPSAVATYFSGCYTNNPYCYVCADVLYNPSINYVDNDDAYEILQYSACMGVGGTYTGPGRFGSRLYNLDSIV